MFELLDMRNGGFTEICVAPERPDEPSLYRKPSPRFISEMVGRYQLDRRQTWMIGDAQTDVEAGLAANVGAVLLDGGKPVGNLTPSVVRCRSLADFYERLRAV